MAVPLMIISGGQTGADRAGLEAAEQLGIPTGGWCPKGCRTDVGPAPELITRFGLRETGQTAYVPRTYYNVHDSDGTVWFGDPESPGGRLTTSLCKRLERPLFICPWLHGDAIEIFRRWVAEHQIKMLNVAGNRERTNPGIGERVKQFLMEVLSDANKLDS